ncbi:hypothetical protein [Pseudomonas sp. GL-RE-20]|uniref:hypothetical protein n=1 Tax=Pseudomonas sp. GL-RE-20 TaxID=2832372 RepID=UPI001CBEC3DA|nr:hypothetical protein [Pseudomonas sp. GL-RE-20]
MSAFGDALDDEGAGSSAQQAQGGVDPMQLYYGAARSVDNMGLAAGRMIGTPVTQAVDWTRSLFTDEPTHSTQEYLNEKLGQLQARADSLAPRENDSLANKLMNAGGGFAGNLAAMAATGGLSRAPAVADAVATGTLPRVLGEVGQATRTMAVPAITDAVNTGHDVYTQTDDLSDALKASAAAGAANIGMGLLPASLPGNLATRLATGAPVGALTGEASRQLRNMALPETMQTPFNAQDAIVNGLTGSVLAGALGRAPERPGATPRPEAMPQPAQQQQGMPQMQATLAGQADQFPGPQPQAPAAPTPFAGSANVRPLFESMGMDQQQMDKSLDLLRDVEPDIEAARRGTISWEETGQLAALTGTTVEKLRKHRVGVAFNAEEQVAATRLLKDQTLKTLELGNKISTGTAGEIDQANFLQALADLRTTQKAVMSSRAEIGRAMSAMRADVTTMKDAGRMLESVGGAQGAKAIADALTTAARVGGVEAANKMARASGSDAFWTFYKSALLSSPDTHVVNMVSNLFTSAMQVPTRLLAGGIGGAKRAVGLNGETRMGESAYQLAGMLEGAVSGAKGAVESWKTGEDAFGGNKAEIYRTDHPGQKVWGMPLRLLQSEDAFFKHINNSMEMHAVAYRMASQELKGQGPAAVHKRVQELIANPPQELVDAGHDAALFHTFNNNAGKLTQAVNNLRYSLPHGTGNLVVPFLKTPANLITYAIKHSPAAPIFREVRNDLMASGARQEEALARMGIGSLLISLGAVGAMNGSLTGGGPEDPDKRKAWLAAGNQPYSMKVHGQWYAYNRIEPLASLVGIAADIAHGSEKQDLGLASIFKAVGRNFTSKTWLQGLSGVMQAMSDPDRYGESFLARTGATLAQPVTLLSHLGRYGDPYQRDTDRGSFLDQLKYRLPGETFGRESLPIKTDHFGQPLMEAQRQIGRAGPVPITTPSDDPVRIEAARIGWTPGTMQNHFSVPTKVQGQRSKRFDLTDDQARELSEIAGARMHAAAGNLMRTKYWATLNDDERQDALDKIMKEARAAARVAFVPYLAAGKRGLIDLYRKQTSSWKRPDGGKK